MLANKSSSTLYKTVMMAQTQMRFFGVLPKLPKVELTMRTPYRTFFDSFNQFTRIYVHTQKGLIAIGNRSIPRIYLLPPGELTVKNIQSGDGNFSKSDSGLFIHTGGWLFVHDNNSIEVNLLECTEKENFAFEKLDNTQSQETETNAGRIAASLQDKTVKLLQRRR
ncbi:UNKNOWN [Stylonychia lemnae]|uniref:Uncharacterized protein n=1 Tax=Stylonychia lemnae TaxID=5949 RepID=A0A078AJV9_STYLE|nr:UNKNOWN [Stylonychia lemnae]|eukprot:CDW81093.1 UNKNOWN [Stylonychia lemnae]